jgi:hypothetical protein
MAANLIVIFLANVPLGCSSSSTGDVCEAFLECEYRASDCEEMTWYSDDTASQESTEHTTEVDECLLARKQELESCQFSLAKIEAWVQLYDCDEPWGEYLDCLNSGSCDDGEWDDYCTDYNQVVDDCVEAADGDIDWDSWC